VNVHDEDRLARISRLRESIQIGEVQAGVPNGGTRRWDRSNGVTRFIISFVVTTQSESRSWPLAWVRMCEQMLALALEGVLRRQDLLDKVFGSVSSRGREAVGMTGD